MAAVPVYCVGVITRIKSTKCETGSLCNRNSSAGLFNFTRILFRVALHQLPAVWIRTIRDRGCGVHQEHGTP